MTLTVREMMNSEVDVIIEYFFNSNGRMSCLDCG
jgi:hypothetical protein